MDPLEEIEKTVRKHQPNFVRFEVGYRLLADLDALGLEKLAVMYNEEKSKTSLESEYFVLVQYSSLGKDVEPVRQYTGSRDEALRLIREGVDTAVRLSKATAHNNRLLERQMLVNRFSKLTEELKGAE